MSIETLKNWFEQERGRMSRLAVELGIEHTSIYSWKRVPAERAADVERITGISRHELRPDVFGPMPSRAHARTLGGDR